MSSLLSFTERWHPHFSTDPGAHQFRLAMTMDRAWPQAATRNLPFGVSSTTIQTLNVTGSSRTSHTTRGSCVNMRDSISFATRGITSWLQSNAHHATGWAAGLIAAAVVTKAGAAGPYHVWGVLSICAGVFGGTAPDWLEVAWWTRARKLWITHRTLTHWGVGWLALLAVSYHFLGIHPWAAISFGFACGGLMHLFADWPNPLGVPWLVSRHSLNWWNSGRCDALIVGAAWIAAAVARRPRLVSRPYGLRLLHAL